MFRVDDVPEGQLLIGGVDLRVGVVTVLGEHLEGRVGELVPRAALGGGHESPPDWILQRVSPLPDRSESLPIDCVYCSIL
jgi:hypothetical protein